MSIRIRINCYSSNIGRQSVMDQPEKIASFPQCFQTGLRAQYKRFFFAWTLGKASLDTYDGLCFALCLVGTTTEYSGVSLAKQSDAMQR